MTQIIAMVAELIGAIYSTYSLLLSLSDLSYLIRYSRKNMPINNIHKALPRGLKKLALILDPPGSNLYHTHLSVPR